MEPEVNEEVVRLENDIKSLAEKLGTYNLSLN